MTSSTSDMIDIGGGDFDLTEQVDLQILSNVMDAFSNGQTVTFKFADNKDLVLEQTNVDIAESGYVSLSSSGNSKVKTCFSNVLTSVYNTEIYLDNSAGTIDFVVSGA